SLLHVDTTQHSGRKTSELAGVFPGGKGAQRANEGAYKYTQPNARGGATQHSGKKTSERAGFFPMGKGAQRANEGAYANTQPNERGGATQPSGKKTSEARFLRWRARNTVAHRDPNRRIVYVSLKAPGAAPGDLSAAQMEQLARLARAYSDDEIRVSHEQNLVLAQVRRDDLFEVWRALHRLGLATANIGTLNDMICCPGLDFCSLANAGTIPIARQINARISELDRLYRIGEIKLKMSGCMNACGHHHVGHIGVLGVDKKGEEWYQITLGGNAGGDADGDARLGARLGPAVPRDQVAATIERLIEVYLELRRDGERFLDCVLRLGVEPFKQRIYPPKRHATDQEPRDHQQPVAA
ncbi:MAG: hypothetical protein ACR2P7_06045, partial [bacterium]